MTTRRLTVKEMALLIFLLAAVAAAQSLGQPRLLRSAKKKQSYCGRGRVSYLSPRHRGPARADGEVNRVRPAITYWGAKQRLDLLTTFRKRVIDYYAAAHWDVRTNEWTGSKGAPEIRRRINEEMRSVTLAMQFVGISTTIDYAPPATTGGLAGRVSLLGQRLQSPENASTSLCVDRPSG